MAITITSSLVVLVILIAILVGYRRHKRYGRWEKLHARFAKRRSLKHNFIHQDNFQFYGSYRDYKVQVKPEKIDERLFSRFCIEMINPNRKALRISRSNEAFPSLEKEAIIDHPFPIKHDIGEWLVMQTNDLLFSSLILSDDIRISLHEVFSKYEAALLYIYDEELVLLIPQTLEYEEDMIKYEKALEILCDIKDELN
ncbi:MAG: hypothetical protein AAGM67_06320 [Bacteroidota bacterium]